MKAKGRTISGFFLACGLIGMILLSACSSPGGRRPGRIYDDTVIAASVKTRLTEMMGVKVLGVDVDVFQGEVTLQGRVRSANEESRVVAVAATTPGVRQVNNLLKIIP